MTRQRRNLPAGVFFGRKQTFRDLTGQRFGDVVSLGRAVSGTYEHVRCDHGHETLKHRVRLMQAGKGKRSSENVRCAECTRLERERKFEDRMGWPKEPEAAE